MKTSEQIIYSEYLREKSLRRSRFIIHLGKNRDFEINYFDLSRICSKDIIYSENMGMR